MSSAGRLAVANAAIEAHKKRQRSQSPKLPQTCSQLDLANSALKEAKLELFRDANQLKCARQKTTLELKKSPELCKRLCVANAAIKTYKKDRSRSRSKKKESGGGKDRSRSKSKSKSKSF